MELELWDYAGGDPAFVLKEIKKLGMSKPAIAKLEEGMSRVEKRTTRGGESSQARGSIWELRVDIDKRWYRLLFARVDERYVALTIVVKKRNDLDTAWLDRADKRLRDHG